MARPKGTGRDRQPILDDDYKKLMIVTRGNKNMCKASKLKLLRAYTLLFHGGFRISEIANLTIKDLQDIQRNKSLILEDTKTNRTELVRFSSSTISIFQELDISDTKEYLFYKNGSDQAMSTGGLTAFINSNLKDKLSRLHTSHSFRAGYVTRIVEATGNISIAQKLARHTDPKTTLRYIGATNKQIENALEKVFT